MTTTSKAVSSKAKAKNVPPMVFEAPPEAILESISSVSSKPSVMDFALQQLSDPKPVVKDITETEEFKKALAQAISSKIKAAKPAKIPRIKAEQKNGVSRPSVSSICGLIWSACDQITAKLGSPAPIILVKAAMPNENDHTVKTQYARWRQFNGITGRVEIPASFLKVIPEIAE